MSRPNLTAAPLCQAVAEWARTSIEVRYLLAFRKLSSEAQETWLKAGGRMADGMPVHEAALLAYREVGMSEAEVTAAMATLPMPAGKA